MKRISLFGLAFVSLGLLAAALIFSPQVAFAAEVGNTVPHPTNSDPNGGHVFFMRANPRNGSQRDVHLTAYYPRSFNEWRSSYIQFFPNSGVGAAQVCNAINGPANDYMQVTIYDPERESNKRVYKIDRADVCKVKNSENTDGNGPSNNRNVFYARYGLPNRPSQVDDNTKMYKLKMLIEYTDQDIADAGGIRFEVKASSPSAKLGVVGGDLSFPLIADWDEHNRDNTDIKIPFGICSENTRAGKIGFYDADQSGFDDDDIRFRVKNLTTGRFVELRDLHRAHHPNGDKTIVRPAEGTNKDLSSAWMDVQSLHRYEIQIFELDPQNTIDVRLPGESVFGGGGVCDPEATLEAKAEVRRIRANGDREPAKGSTISLPANGSGVRLEFENFVVSSRLKNISEETFRMDVKGTESLSEPAADWNGAARNEDRAIADRDGNGRTIPSGPGADALIEYETVITTPGTYCRVTTINKARTPDFVQYDPNSGEAEACVTVVTANCGRGTLTRTPDQDVDLGDAVSLTVVLNGDGNGDGEQQLGPGDRLYLRAFGLESNVHARQTSLNHTPAEARGYEIIWGFIDNNNNHGGSYECTSILPVYKRPYMQVFNGDVNTTASVVGGSCQRATGPIQAYRPNPYDKGSGTQVGIFAGGEVDGFMSAMSHSSLPAPKSLTFAQGDDEFGIPFDGKVCGSASQDPDWERDSTDSRDAITFSSIQNSTVSGEVLHVMGDKSDRDGKLFINQNTTFGGFANLSNMPSLKVVVRGDIYINSSVTELDGIFMATGTIYTCTQGNTQPTDLKAILAACSTAQLKINGALIAPKIYYLRLIDGLNTPNRPSEEIIYNPMIWLQALRSASGAGPDSGKYDAYTTLPPIL